MNSRSETIATQYYAYDSLNRIQIATENVTPNGQSAQLSWRQQFGYDRYGNRNFDEANTTTLPKECSNNTEVCAAIRPVVNPSVNAVNNRLNGYTFDAAGNTIQDAELRKFTYDAENKQAKVETVNSGGTVTGTIGQYSYDGEGKRIKKKGYTNNVLTEATIFVYDAAGKLVAEYSSEIASVNDAKVAYLTNDHLGSPRITTDQLGQVIARHDYHPFGEEIGTLNGGSPHRTTALNYTADSVRQKFTGYERDNETDLDFAQSRMYKYSHGRFTSPDPLLSSGSIEDPQTWNRYAYVLNDPINYVDPDGLYECKGSADECKAFRNNLASAQAKLANIEKKYGKNSDEYTKAQKAVGSYGCESKGGNCLGADGKAIKDAKGNFVKDTAGNVQVSFDWKGTSPANTSANTGTGIVKVQFGKGNDSNLGLIANEGINSADFQSALSTGKSVTQYQSERDGLFVQAVFGELRASANGAPSAHFNLTKGQVNYWEKALETPDHKAVRAGRESAISKTLTDVYKLSPTNKRALLPIPRGYKPRR